MKISIIILLVIPVYTFAQNVGIGTSNPDVTLDVRRGTAPNGTAQFWGTDYISHFNFGSTEDTYIRGGKVGSHVILNDVSGLGNVGIKWTTPYAPLTFNNDLGQKISLYGTPTNSYGFGIMGALFQIHSDAFGADIAFGYGSSATFVERMRIKGSGNVGIGINNPAFLLDVNGRMQLRGSSPNDAGIWLSNTGGARGFIGLENDNYIGLYGANGAGWKFTMNTQSGALKINATEGNSGQILKSNGPGQPVGWSNPLNMLYNNMVQYDQAGTQTVGPLSVGADVIGMNNKPLTISSTSKVIFSGSIDLKSNGCFGCGGSTATFSIVLNGPGVVGFVSAGRHTSNIGSEETKTFAVPNRMFTLTPGTYNVNCVLSNQNISGPTVTGSFGRLNIIVIPE